MKNGGNALDTVEAAVVELENFALFNAGKGAVFTHEGKNEMDASIMDGAKLKAGAVAFVKNVKNPIKLARLVMEKTEHIPCLPVKAQTNLPGKCRLNLPPTVIFLQIFATSNYLKPANLESFNSTTRLMKQKLSKKNLRNQQMPNTKSVLSAQVACDFAGNIAAATSTGGMTNKKFGRIGDTPIIGAGTYAENSTCAVSCTGHGEYFMLGASAFDAAARMKYKGLTVAQAAGETIEYLTKIGGEGGLIAVDNLGNIALPFNSEGMYRGHIKADGYMVVEIYK